MKSRILGACLLGGAALALGAAAVRHARRTRFDGRVVVISGGSRGLGLAIAKQLAAEGAQLVLLARDLNELEDAHSELENCGSHVSVHVCDITRRDEVEAAFEEIGDEFGGVDMLINNAGVIQVGPLENQEDRDFDEAFAIHVYGPLNTIRAALPLMRGNARGRIVNISSIGGRVAVPHMLPYSASKFALSGLSQALAAELREQGIRVTTVHPGLMRTGSHRHALFKGKHADEASWFTALASMPLLSIRPERAARKIIEAARYGRSELTFPLHFRIAAAATGICPRAAIYANSLVARLMPSPSRALKKKTQAGRDIDREDLPSWLTPLADRAGESLNE